MIRGFQMKGRTLFVPAAMIVGMAILASGCTSAQVDTAKTDLQSKVDELSNQVGVLQTTVAGVGAQGNSNTQEIATIGDKADALDSSIEALKRQIGDITAEKFVSLEDRVSALESEVSDLKKAQSQYGQLAAEVAALKDADTVSSPGATQYHPATEPAAQSQSAPPPTPDITPTAPSGPITIKEAGEATGFKLVRSWSQFDSDGNLLINTLYRNESQRMSTQSWLSVSFLSAGGVELSTNDAVSLSNVFPGQYIFLQSAFNVSSADAATVDLTKEIDIDLSVTTQAPNLKNALTVSNLQFTRDAYYPQFVDVSGTVNNKSATSFYKSDDATFTIFLFSQAGNLLATGQVSPLQAALPPALSRNWDDSISVVDPSVTSDDLQNAQLTISGNVSLSDG